MWVVRRVWERKGVRQVQAPSAHRPVPQIDPNDALGVPIAEVCGVLGVPLPTLRSWELRYAMPGIGHQRGGHRRYLPAEVHAIKLMRDEIARGARAGLAASTVRQVLGIGGTAEVLIHWLLQDSEQMDTQAILAVLDEAAGELGLLIN